MESGEVFRSNEKFCAPCIFLWKINQTWREKADAIKSAEIP